MNEVIGLTIRRRVIEENDTKMILRYFNDLTTKGSNAFQSSVFIFEGYEDDPAEVYEIRGIRDWVHSMFNHCPHFMYFVSFQLDSHLTMLACLADIESFHRGEPKLSTNDYMNQGYGLNELPKLQHKISVNDILFSRMKKALLDYGKIVEDESGAEFVVKMIHSFRRQ